MRNAHVLTIPLALAACSSALPPPTALPTFVRAVALPGVRGRIDHLAWDPTQQRLFVAALGNGSLEVMDVGAGTRAGTVPDLPEPQGIVFLAKQQRVVVACGGDGSVHTFDAATLQPGPVADLGDDADNVRVIAAYDEALAVGHGHGAITCLDPRTLQTLAPLDVGGHPESFQFDPENRLVYANVPDAPGGAAIVVGRLPTGEVLARLPLADHGANFPMALDAGHRRLYVGCRRPAALLVFDLITNARIATLPCVGDADDVFADPTTGWILVIGGGGTVDVFATADHRAYTKVGAVPTAAGARTGLLVPERRALFVAVPARDGHEAEIREYRLP